MKWRDANTRHQFTDDTGDTEEKDIFFIILTENYGSLARKFLLVSGSLKKDYF